MDVQKRRLSISVENSTLRFLQSSVSILTYVARCSDKKRFSWAIVKEKFRDIKGVREIDLHARQELTGTLKILSTETDSA
jgi:hypothetical protein